MGSSDEITRLIYLWREGHAGAENALFEALYQRLHSIAAQSLRNEPQGQSLGPTALVHEAYLKFQRAERLEVNSRGHFLALSARVMHRILVDRARARRSEKRGGDVAHSDDQTAVLVARDSDADQILAVDRALEELASHSARQAQLVELRYFAGFTEEESAAALGISTRTARREWQIARTRLRVSIDGTASPS